MRNFELGIHHSGLFDRLTSFIHPDKSICLHRMFNESIIKREMFLLVDKIDGYVKTLLVKLLFSAEQSSIDSMLKQKDLIFLLSPVSAPKT